MNKLVVAAALVASSFAVPVLPVAAAPALSDAQVNCLIFPALKKECWERGAEMLKAAPKTVAAVAEDATARVKLPMLWTCTAAPKGSGYLLDC